MKSYQIKLDNFKKAFESLLLVANMVILDEFADIKRDAMIQRFEFSYELAWKLMKAYLEEMGLFDLNTPKTVIKTAFSTGLIDDEKIWLKMIEDRNLTTHTYEEKNAIIISDNIKDYYIEIFRKLLNKIEGRGENK